MLSFVTSVLSIKTFVSGMMLGGFIIFLLMAKRVPIQKEHLFMYNSIETSCYYDRNDREVLCSKTDMGYDDMPSDVLVELYPLVK